MLCRDPSAHYARYVCPGCGFDRRVPFSCKTHFCPSCGKVRVDHWVNDIARDLFDVTHLHVTLTTGDLLWPFSFADRPLLKVLLKAAAQAVRKSAQELYPGVCIGMIYTVHTGGRDLGHPPLATSHITDYDGQFVTYWYIDSNTGQRVTITYSALSPPIPSLRPGALDPNLPASLVARADHTELWL
jgi:hypothetical protein